MYSAGVGLLRENGYHRYEVSNFSRPGRTSLHNQGYWNGVEYLAFGPGAHGFFAGRRSISPRSFEGYLEWGAGGFDEASCQVETLTSENLVSEAVLLGLRQAEGLHLGKLGRLGFGLPPAAIRKWENVGMLVHESDSIRLIGEGWLFLDEIGSDLLARGHAVETADAP
jgi:oxygen-independent coproporphyrinogen-3 oxidase